MKGEEKIEIVASTCSKSYFDAVRYHQNMSYKKNNDLTKISNELLVCGKVWLLLIWIQYLKAFVLTEQSFQIAAIWITIKKI